MAALSMLRLNQSYNLLGFCTVPLNVPGRNISKRKLLNQLNLPVQPKRPPTAFVLFFQEIKDKLKTQEPKFNGEDLLKTTAQLWKELSSEDKEKYKNNYQALKDKYIEEMKNFSEKLSSHEKEQLESFSIHYQNMKDEHAAAAVRRLKEKELKKPKHPVPSYTKFVLDLNLGMNLSKAWKLAKDKWNELPEKTREKYKSQYKEELEQYQKALKAWELEMIEKGHTDIVRQKTLKGKIMSDDI